MRKAEGGEKTGNMFTDINFFFTKIESKISDEKRYFKAKYSILIRIWLKINLNTA